MARKRTLSARCAHACFIGFGHPMKEVVALQTVQKPPTLRRQVARLRWRFLQATSPPDRDQALYELVVLYRREPNPEVAGAILDVLRVGILVRALRFNPVPPAVDVDDVWQELAWSVLVTAETIPLASQAYLERRLMLRAAFRVTRSLRREARRAAQQQSLEALAEDEQDEDS